MTIPKKDDSKSDHHINGCTLLLSQYMYLFIYLGDFCDRAIANNDYHFLQTQSYVIIV